MDWRDYIVSNVQVQKGRPTIKGTRISVEFLLSLLASGWSIAEVYSDNVVLCEAHVRASIAFATEAAMSGGWENIGLPYLDKEPDQSNVANLAATRKDDSIPFLDDSGDDPSVPIENVPSGLSGLSEVEVADITFTEDLNTVPLDTSPESVAKTKMLD